jgi:hypothetical protein
MPTPALAGPPYMTDDPEPVDLHHTETFLFASGSYGATGREGVSGVDFNYGLAQDAHVNLVVPLDYAAPKDGEAFSGVGNIELALKYRFFNRNGWQAAVFPRLYLKSASKAVGDHHAAFFLPVWVQKDWGEWSSFGGGGCVVNRSGEARNFCQGGGAVTRQVLPKLNLGAEIVHQSAAEKGGRASTGMGAGLTYDLNDHYHLMAYAGPNLQHIYANGRYVWYAALQITY